MKLLAQLIFATLVLVYVVFPMMHFVGIQWTERLMPVLAQAQ